MILLVDNYDSFTYNLVHLFEELGADVAVYRNDAISVGDAEALAPDRLVISPGPGRPVDAGISVELIRRLGPHVPTLGVCLGHQAIVEAFGGSVGQAKALLHGKASRVQHDGEGVFAGLPEEIVAGRYHSLAAQDVPEEPHAAFKLTIDADHAMRRLQNSRGKGVVMHNPEEIGAPGRN